MTWRTLLGDEFRHDDGCTRAVRHQPSHSRVGQEPYVQAHYLCNNRFADALQAQAFSALRNSLGARRCYDKQRAPYVGYNFALRHLGNRLVGILHGYLKARAL